MVIFIIMNLLLGLGGGLRVNNRVEGAKITGYSEVGQETIS
jgi:hypothetical protein